jgi:C4-dicarboxylate transporter DctM subunit
VGVNLFTAANLTGGDLDAISKHALWCVLMDIVVLLILSFFPILSLYLPVLAGLYQPGP